MPLVALGAVLSTQAPAQGPFQVFPIQNFIAGQASAPATVLPPIPNFIGWTAPNAAVSMDYAGLANDTYNLGLGTFFQGGVLVEDLGARRRVTVILHTFNALSWAIDTSAGLDWTNSPLTFGWRASDVAAGKPAALGVFMMMFVYTTDERYGPNSYFPSIHEVVFNPQHNESLENYTVYSGALGDVHNGQGQTTPGLMTNVQLMNPYTEQIRVWVR